MSEEKQNLSWSISPVVQRLLEMLLSQDKIHIYQWNKIYRCQIWIKQ